MSLLQEHLGYVSDTQRIEQFKLALSKTIKPGDRVVDLGCGSGVLGLLALQAGAAHLTAIDNSSILDLARESFLQGGYGDKVTVIRGNSGEVDLPEPVDLVICDHVGYFGFDYGILEFLKDARKRFLKPGGSVLPSRVRLELAAVASEECSVLARGWQSENVLPQFRWANRYAVNTKHSVGLKKGDVLSPPVVLGEIDLSTDETEFFTWSAELRIEQDAVMHGLGGWFDCELAAGVWMTNSPLAESPIQRSQAFLPIADAVPVSAGDIVKATVMARLSDSLIAWTVEFPATGKRYRHSTWEGMLLSSEELLRANPNRVPSLGSAGEARMKVLSYCDGTNTAREIEQTVLREHPDLFPSPQAISDFVFRVLGSV